MSDSLRDAGPQPSEIRGITDFWAWWATARPGIEAAIAVGDVARAAPDISQAVHRIHPGLQWEIGGQEGLHQLVVTAAGDPELRSTAARWLLAAPQDRSGWDFHATRQPDPQALSQVLMVGDQGAKVALAELSVAVVEDDESRRLDVAVHHDHFATLEPTPALHIAYMALDWALGEDDVERWIGEVTAVPERPADAIPLAELPMAVARLADRHPRAFALLAGTIDGLPLSALIQTPLSPVDFPLFDQHIAVVVPYTTMNPGRLQTGPSAERLDAFDEALTALMGEDAVFVAAVSHDGRRVFHYYTDPLNDVAVRIANWQHRWSEGRVEVSAEHDPAWHAVRPFRA